MSTGEETMSHPSPILPVAAPAPAGTGAEGGPVVELIGADQAPLLARPFYAGGDPGPIVAALAHVPELLEAAMAFLSVVYGPLTSPDVTRELVILRVSAVASCRFCVGCHTPAALDAGLRRDQVVALRGGAAVEAAFEDAADLALIAWVDALARPGPVDDSARRALKAHFLDHEIVELTTVAVATLLLNRFCTALALPLPAAVADRLTAEGLG